MKPQNFFLKSLVVILSLFFSAQAYAGTYDIKEKTPEVEKALSGRQERYNTLQTLKAQGAAGENNQGYVQALAPSAAAVVEAENADRRTLYRAIVDQNGLGPSGLEQVQVVFADVQREKARAGDSMQLPSGEWTKK